MKRQLFVLLIAVSSVVWAQESSRDTSGIRHPRTIRDPQVDSLIRTRHSKNRIEHLFVVPKAHAILSDYIISLEDKNLVLWNLDDGKMENLCRFEKGTSVNRLAVSQDEEQCAVITLAEDESETGPFIGSYSLKERKWLWKIEAENEYYSGLWFIEGEQTLVVTGRKTILFLDSNTGRIKREEKKLLKDYMSSNTVVTEVRHSPTGRYMLIWQQPMYRGDGISWLSPKGSIMVTLWDIVGNKVLYSFPRPDKGYAAAVFTSDEKTIIFISPDSVISQMSISGGEMIRKAKGDANYALATDHYVALARKDVRILTYPGFEETVYFVGFESWYNVYSEMPFAFSRDGKLFAIDQAGKLSLYETDTWKNRWSVWMSEMQ